MRARATALDQAARSAAVLAASTVMVGSFGFLFLAQAPVKGVTDLYWGLHLDGLMTLDDLFGLCHVAVYAALTATLGRFTRTLGGWLTLIGGMVTLGLAVEIMQGLGGIRSFSLDDMLANGLGICIGFFVLVLIGPPRRPRRRRRR